MDGKKEQLGALKLLTRVKSILTAKQAKLRPPKMSRNPVASAGRNQVASPETTPIVPGAPWQTAKVRLKTEAPDKKIKKAEITKDCEKHVPYAFLSPPGTRFVPRRNTTSTANKIKDRNALIRSV